MPKTMVKNSCGNKDKSSLNSILDISCFEILSENLIGKLETESCNIGQNLNSAIAIVSTV